MNENYKAKAFVVETSQDGKKWKAAYEQNNNQLNTTDIDITPVTARYIRLRINDKKGVAISDIEIYGSRL